MFLDEIKFTTKPTFSHKSYWLYKLFIEFCKKNKCMHILYNVEGNVEGIDEKCGFDAAIENFTMLTGLTAFFEKREDIFKCLHGECNAAFERIQLWRYFFLKNYTKIPIKARIDLGSNMRLRTMEIMRRFGDRGNKKVKNALENLNLYSFNE